MYTLIKKLLREGLLLEITIGDAWSKFYSDTTKFPALNGSIELFNKLNDLYPRNGDNFNKSYFNWLYNLLRNGKLKEEDFYKAKEYLTTFVKFYNKIPQEERDINQYKSLPELYNVVKDYINSDEPTSKSDEKRRIKNEEIEKVFEDEDVLIMIPKTERASCLIGKGTQWCTAADVSDNQFSSHNRLGPLYVIINKNNDDKHQLHFETNQLMDANDNPVSAGDFFEEYNNTYEFFKGRYDKFWDFVIYTGIDDAKYGRYDELFNQALGEDSVTPSVLEITLNELRDSDEGEAVYTGFMYEDNKYNIKDEQLENIFLYIDDKEVQETVIQHLNSLGFDFSDTSYLGYKQAIDDLEKHKLEVNRTYKIDKNRTLRINKVSFEDQPENRRFNVTIDNKTGYMDIETLVNYIHQGHLFERLINRFGLPTKK